MRSVIFTAPLFAAAVLAQSSGSGSASVTDSSRAASVTSISTIPYSNPNTQYTTETDSRGVITGMPTVDTTPATANTDVGQAATSIAPLPPGDSSVNMVPAGVPTGIHTITIGNGSVTASVNKSTTILLTSISTSATGSSRASGSAAGSDGSDGSSASGASGASGSGSSTGSASSSSSSGAAAHVKVAGGALVGAAGFFAALL